MARSPLFFGGDPTHLRDDNFTLGLLTNAAVLEVGRADSLVSVGSPGVVLSEGVYHSANRVVHRQVDEVSVGNHEVRRHSGPYNNSYIVWTAYVPADDAGHYYSAAFNVGDGSTTVHLNATDFGTSAAASIGLQGFDAWTGNAVGSKLGWSM